MIFAVVKNEVVINVIALEKRTADAFPDAVAAGDIPVQIGDTYQDGAFYRDGAQLLTPLERLEDEHIAELAALIEEIYMEDLEVIDNV